MFFGQSFPSETIFYRRGLLSYFRIGSQLPIQLMNDSLRTQSVAPVQQVHHAGMSGLSLSYSRPPMYISMLFLGLFVCYNRMEDVLKHKPRTVLQLCVLLTDRVMYIDLHCQSIETCHQTSVHIFAKY